MTIYSLPDVYKMEGNYMIDVLILTAVVVCLFVCLGTQRNHRDLLPNLQAVYSRHLHHHQPRGSLHPLSLGICKTSQAMPSTCLRFNSGGSFPALERCSASSRGPCLAVDWICVVSTVSHPCGTEPSTPSTAERTGRVGTPSRPISTVGGGGGLQAGFTSTGEEHAVGR